MRKAMFHRTIGFCVFCHQHEIERLEQHYQAKFVRFLD